MASGKRVVCIEDEPEMIDLVKLILSRKGYQVVGAMGGREGLEAVGREMPDLVLLDLMMPVLDGWQFLQEARQNPALASIPVVVTSAAPDLPNDTAGALRKPLDLDELVGVLHQYC